MTSYAVGVDIIEIERVKKALQRHKGRFLNRIYTPVEVAYCRGRAHELAARFAAKEAVMKALGTGARGLAWREIEVLPNRRGKPIVYLYGRALERARQIGVGGIEVSLTHSRQLALASVVSVQKDSEDAAASREWLLGRLKERGLL
jgi:holo-[acyl-carrier protein] synthase